MESLSKTEQKIAEEILALFKKAIPTMTKEQEKACMNVACSERIKMVNRLWGRYLALEAEGVEMDPDVERIFYDEIASLNKFRLLIVGND